MFAVFAAAVAAKFDSMTKAGEVYASAFSGQDLWDAYLAAFPEGTNPMYRVRTEHDGSYDKNFIRRMGHVVSLDDGGVKTTIWDIPNLPAPYNTVATYLDSMVRSAEIVSIFRINEMKMGRKESYETMPDGKIHTWNHFFADTKKVFSNSVGEVVGQVNTNVGVMKRGLEEITSDSVSSILDLIEANALYRGQEFKNNLEIFQSAQRLYKKQPTDLKRNGLLWMNSNSNVLMIRNTAIGTLLTDLSEGVDLEHAVKSFEAKVAPTNYKRPTALITPTMVNKAMEKVTELGLEDSIPRRHARMVDVSINDVLWADDRAKNVMKEQGIHGLLMESAVAAAPKTDKAEKISIEDFIKDVLPKAASIDLLLKNQLAKNMVSITAPKHDSASSLLKWDNGFGWAYRGGVTDAIKERVKAAGGNTEADLRVSLAWFNGDDLDLHSMTPQGRVYFGDKNGNTSKNILDVDMNAGAPRNSVDPVENQSFINPKNGRYKFTVNNYSQRGTDRIGFQVQVEGLGVNTTLHYPHSLRSNQSTDVCEFDVVGGVIQNFTTNLNKDDQPQLIWGLKTETFVRVQTVMLSPNHWGDQAIGNKHYFLMLDGATNDEDCRGIFNEFLRSDLEEHRKVFEVLGSKTKIEPESDATKQLSGVGFSETLAGEFTVRVKGPKINKLYTITI